MWLEPIPPPLRDRAVEALDAGDVVGFLVTASNESSLDLVFWNQAHLQARGVYERGLMAAFIATRTNNHGWPLDHLRLLFELADRDRLRNEGDPLPGTGPFTVYRGVAGHGLARRVRGLSWTASPEQAAWFAGRLELHDPAVFRVTVDENRVLAYSNERYEQEFIVSLPQSLRPMRVLDGRGVSAAAEVWSSRKADRNP